jgi:hypothetical protein
MNLDLETGRQSTSFARPTSLPPARLSAKCIQPRLVVEVLRISQSFVPASIRSSQCFFTISAYFAHRLSPLRFPARFFARPFFWLTALLGLPLALALPADRPPLSAAFLRKQIEHNVARLVFTLRPHSFLHLGHFIETLHSLSGQIRELPKLRLEHCLSPWADADECETRGFQCDANVMLTSSRVV